MRFSTFRGVFALVTGGFSGLIKYALNVFNTDVLAKIPNKETGVKYIKDIQAVSAFINSIMVIHADDFSEKRKEALASILAAIDELAKALEDFTVNQDELNAIIEKVKKAIDDWKKAR